MKLLIDLHYKLSVTNETVQLGPKQMLGCPDCWHTRRQSVVFWMGCGTGRCQQCAEGFLTDCECCGRGPYCPWCTCLCHVDKVLDSTKSNLYHLSACGIVRHADGLQTCPQCRITKRLSNTGRTSSWSLTRSKVRREPTRRSGSWNRERVLKALYLLCNRTYVVWLCKTSRWVLLGYRSSTTVNEWLSKCRTYWIR